MGRKPMRLGELCEELGGASEGVVRGRLGDLHALGAIAKRGGGMPYVVRNELTDVGHGLLRVVEVLDAWLSRAPDGSIALGDAAAKAASRALVEGWRSRILDALAAQPLSMTELDEAIPDLSYPALARRMNALRAMGLVETAPDGARLPYRIARWGSEGVGPLLAAARFERSHLSDPDVPLTASDVEAAVLIAGPVARLSTPSEGDRLADDHLDELVEAIVPGPYGSRSRSS
jgi:DNA-binding HxlR family transcriptional regulator